MIARSSATQKQSLEVVATEPSRRFMVFGIIRSERSERMDRQTTSPGSHIRAETAKDHRYIAIRPTGTARNSSAPHSRDVSRGNLAGAHQARTPFTSPSTVVPSILARSVYNRCLRSLDWDARHYRANQRTAKNRRRFARYILHAKGSE
jgi:hypothetical protein